MEEIVKIEAKSESVIVIGDANKLVGDLVPGNSAKVTAGGRLIRDFLSNGDYVLLNSSELVENGPYTRIDPADVTKGS